METNDGSLASVVYCQEHIVADGEVERSSKANGVVERTRRCKKCGTRFKTFEMTDDKLAHKQAQDDVRMKELKCDMIYYKGIVMKVSEYYEAMDQIRDDLRGVSLYERAEGD